MNIDFSKQDKMISNRQEKAKSLLIQQIDEIEYQVWSDDRKDYKSVMIMNGAESCGCKDFQYRHNVCKHIYAVRMYCKGRELLS